MDRHSRLSCIFRGIKSRCYNPHHRYYAYYGGRGIKVCNEWFTPHSHEGFRAFKAWALENGYQEGLTIDRIDNDKGYSPDNCRWVTMLVQGNNRSYCHYITFNGVTKTLMEWSRELEIPYITLKQRLNKYGWPVEKALSKVDFRYGSAKGGK